MQCLSLGSQGNLPAGSLTAIEGLLGTQATATNPLPTRQGSDRKEAAPTETDRAALHKTLLSALQESALKELNSKLMPGDQVLSPNLRLVQILAETYQPAGDLPADQLFLSLRVEFEAVVVSGEDLQTLAANVLDANLPAGFTPLPQTLETQPLVIQPLNQPSFEKDFSQAGAAGWEILARRQLQARIPEKQTVRLVLGLPLQKAIQRLAGALPLDAPPQITLSPRWWPGLPFLPFQIDITSQ